MSKKQPPWANAIVDHIEADPKTLRANARNWRTHPPAQRAQLVAAMAALGWITEVILNRVTGNLVDGHLRVEEAIERGEPTVPVTLVELTPEQELLAIAAFDPISYGAGVDLSILDSLLHEVRTDDPALIAMFADVVKAAKALPSPADATKDLLDEGADLGEPAPLRPAPRKGDRWKLGGHVLEVGAEISFAKKGTAEKILSFWEKATGSTATLL